MLEQKYELHILAFNPSVMPFHRLLLLETTGQIEFISCGNRHYATDTIKRA